MRRLHSRRGQTLVELAITALVVGLVAGVGLRAARLGADKDREHNAKLRLQALWSSEKRFYAWKGRYTADWGELSLDLRDTAAEPERDRAYRYEVTLGADARDFRISAVPERAGLRTLTTDRSGDIR